MTQRAFVCDQAPPAALPLSQMWCLLWDTTFRPLTAARSEPCRHFVSSRVFRFSTTGCDEDSASLLWPKGVGLRGGGGTNLISRSNRCSNIELGFRSQPRTTSGWLRPPRPLPRASAVAPCICLQSIRPPPTPTGARRRRGVTPRTLQVSGGGLGRNATLTRSVLLHDRRRGRGVLAEVGPGRPWQQASGGFIFGGSAAVCLAVAARISRGWCDSSSGEPGGTSSCLLFLRTGQQGAPPRSRRRSSFQGPSSSTPPRPIRRSILVAVY